MAELPTGANPSFKLKTINPHDKATRGRGFSFEERGTFGAICSYDPEQIIQCYSLIDKDFCEAELIECCSQCPYAYDRTLIAKEMKRRTNRFPDFIEDLADLEYDNPKCWVYFVGDGEYIKIGVAANVYKRLSQLQVGNPHILDLICAFPLKSAEEALMLEKRLHTEFAEFRVGGEWFNLANHISIEAYRNVCKIYMKEEDNG